MFQPKIQAFATAIRFQKNTPTNSYGELTNVFDDINEYQDGVDGDGHAVMVPYVYLCEWKNAYGQEMIQSLALKLPELGTITMFYVSGISVRDYVLKGGLELVTDAQQAAARYQIVSIDNVENRGQFMVLKARQVVGANG